MSEITASSILFLIVLIGLIVYVAVSLVDVKKEERNGMCRWGSHSLLARSASWCLKPAEEGQGYCTYHLDVINQKSTVELM